MVGSLANVNIKEETRGLIIAELYLCRELDFIIVMSAYINSLGTCIQSYKICESETKKRGRVYI